MTCLMLFRATHQNISSTECMKEKNHSHTMWSPRHHTISSKLLQNVQMFIFKPLHFDKVQQYTRLSPLAVSDKFNWRVWEARRGGDAGCSHKFCLSGALRQQMRHRDIVEWFSKTRNRNRETSWPSRPKIRCWTGALTGMTCNTQLLVLGPWLFNFLSTMRQTNPMWIMFCLLAVLQVAIKEGNKDLYNNAKQSALFLKFQYSCEDLTYIFLKNVPCYHSFTGFVLIL